MGTSTGRNKGLFTLKSVLNQFFTLSYVPNEIENASMLGVVCTQLPVRASYPPNSTLAGPLSLGGAICMSLPLSSVESVALLKSSAYQYPLNPFWPCMLIPLANGCFASLYGV